MKYSEFKAELYEVVRGRKEMAGKRIRILEKDTIYQDTETLRWVRMCNAKKCEGDPKIMGEDKLCIIWYSGRLPRVLYWDTERLYACFVQEGWAGILPEITEKLRGISLCMTADKLVLRPMNYRNHERRLADAVYWKIGDIALVLHTILDEGPNGLVTEIYSRDRNPFFPDEILLTNGLLCCKVFFPAKLELIGQRCRGGKGAYRLTTAGSMESAVSLFYPEVREQLADRFQGDYFVGFPNVHEAVIRPVKYGGPGDLRDCARSAELMRDRSEYLTGRLYRFDRRQDRLIEV